MKFINDADYKVEIRECSNGKNKVIWKCPYHRRWDKMKSRVLYNDYAPSYSNVTVCDEWHNFSSFREWITSFNVNISNLELDKDFISGSVYSPETCILIPKYINNSIIDSSLRRGEYPLGVCLDNTPRLKSKFKASIRKENKSIHLGRFYDPMGAHRAWQLAKINHFESLIIRYNTEELIFPIVEQKIRSIIDKIQNDYDNNQETVDLST